MFFRFLRTRSTPPPVSPIPAVFRFLDPGPLRDGSLELIQPDPPWTSALLLSIQHPDTQRLSPDLAATTPRQIRDFLESCPCGHQSPDPSASIYPAHHFWMRDHDHPNLPIAGAVALRVGHGPEVDLYYGHFGYHVFPPHRGRHFAARSVRLLMPLALRHGMDELWITCNPDNIPSRRTCELLGAQLINTIAVPPNHPLTRRGEYHKCRYRLKTAPEAA